MEKVKTLSEWSCEEIWEECQRLYNSAHLEYNGKRDVLEFLSEVFQERERENEDHFENGYECGLDVGYEDGWQDGYDKAQEEMEE